MQAQCAGTVTSTLGQSGSGNRKAEGGRFGASWAGFPEEEVLTSGMACRAGVRLVTPGADSGHKAELGASLYPPLTVSNAKGHRAWTGAGQLHPEHPNFSQAQ